jgi:hypothetical protein
LVPDLFSNAGMFALLLAIGRFLARRWIPSVSRRLGIPAPVADLLVAAV